MVSKQKVIVVYGSTGWFARLEFLWHVPINDTMIRHSGISNLFVPSKKQKRIPCPGTHSKTSFGEGTGVSNAGCRGGKGWWIQRRGYDERTHWRLGILAEYRPSWSGMMTYWNRIEVLMFSWLIGSLGFQHARFSHGWGAGTSIDKYCSQERCQSLHLQRLRVT